jgi:5S rRNA maturation endonuclease (ribonuclease M5)
MYAHTLSEAVTRGKGTERPFLCPVHGDSRPSASLNIIKQKWYCYTCGAHGSLDGEEALLEPDYLQMQLWFSQKMEENRVYPEAWLARWDAGPIHPYWRDRCGDAAARHFRLGFDADRDAVTYPLRGTAGEVLGVVRRSLGSDDGPKYRYPRGIDVGKLLFNYTTDHRRVVVLVEGALDAIALWNVGIDAFAIYGSKLSPEQITLIDRIDPDYVFTAFDMDKAGWRAHYQVKEGMPHRFVNRLSWPLSWGKDVDEVGPTRLRKVVHEVLVLTEGVCIESSSCRSSGTAQQLKSKKPSSRISTRSGMRIRRSVA